MLVVAITPDGEVREENIGMDILNGYPKFYMYISAISEPYVVAWVPDPPMGEPNDVGALIAINGKLPIAGPVYLGTYVYDQEEGEYEYSTINPETVLDLYAIRKHGECKRGCAIL